MELIWTMRRIREKVSEREQECECVWMRGRDAKTVWARVSEKVSEKERIKGWERDGKNRERLWEIVRDCEGENFKEENECECRFKDEWGRERKRTQKNHNIFSSQENGILFNVATFSSFVWASSNSRPSLAISGNKAKYKTLLDKNRHNWVFSQSSRP